MGSRRRPSTGLEAFNELEAFLARSAKAHAGLGELERESELRGREVCRLALQAHLDTRGHGDVGPALVLGGPDGPVRLTHKRLHTRRLLTIFGEVSVTRMGYGARGQRSIHPLDDELCLPARTYSYEICRRLTKAAVCGPFAEAIAFIADMTGVVVPMRSAEAVVADAAADFDAFYASRAGKAPGRGEILVGAIDCKGIPMVKPEPAAKVVRRGKGQKAAKKKMATVAAVYSQRPRVRTVQEVLDSLFASPDAARPKPRARPTAKRVWASLTSNKDSFIADVRAEMSRRDPCHRRTWVMVTDGERALQRRVTNSFKGVTLVLDLLHVMEKLWKVAYAFHPEGSDQAKAFVYQRAERILSGEVSQVIKGLRQMATKHHLTGEKAKVVKDVTGYYYANRQRMRYDQYLNKGWPIASGAVEGACKNLVRTRFERSGMRWTPEMAEPMLQMRAVYLSGDFEAYWEFHIHQEQRRLHRKGQWRVVRK
ncbi:MAG: ISKra4 family transposase [Acidimicrobiia bacterium]